ncbi:MAG: hypothetical protein EB120_14455, partial [Proteobacteria bacterium]|nr:hypothetical protein [Pseudomonadota bacterium]
MWNAIARLFLPFCLSLTLFADTQAGFQYFSENTYRDTLGPLIVNRAAFNERWRGSLTTQFGFSSSDWEFVSFAYQSEFKLFSRLTLSARLSHRIHLPEPFSRTGLLFGGRAETPSLWGITGFGTVGWYRRFAQLRNATVIPVFFESSFSEHDFATEIGLDAELFQRWRLLTKVSTIDETETYNINNPYVEVSLIYKSDGLSRWLATARQQLSLGFGRVDRTVFCLSYQ